MRHPQEAIGAPVWLVAPADPDDEPVTCTLADLLAERVNAQQVADGWYARIEADQAATRRAGLLQGLARGQVLAELLDDPVAAAAYQHLLADVDDVDAFTAGHPRLAAQVLDLCEHPDDDRRRERLRTVLRATHDRLLAEQTRAVLAAPGTAAGHPRAAAAAAALQAGRLLEPWVLAEPAVTGAQLQQRLLADHCAAREADLAERHQALSRWARRRVDPVAEANAYDEQHLMVCDVCAIAVPTVDAERWWPAVGDPECQHCHTGHLIAYADRGQVPTLTERLTALRARLRD